MNPGDVTVKRILVASAVACLSLMPVGTGPAVSVASPARALTVVREYGDGPVQVPSGVQRVRIAFHGRSADKVRLRTQDSCPVALRRAGGRVVKPFTSAASFWKLPARGSYVFSYRRCASAYHPRLQLEKLVTHRLLVDGDPTSLPHRRGYVDAALLRVPPTGRVQVTPTRRHQAGWDTVMLPDGTEGDLEFSLGAYVEAGLPVSDGLGALNPDDEPLAPVHAGDRLLFIALGAMDAQATSAIVVPAVLDGAAVTVTNGGVPFRETQAEFDGVAGQWVHLERVGVPATYGFDPGLVDPQGRQLLNPTSVYHPYWQLPVTGRYRVQVPTSPSSFSGTLRVRTVRVLTEPMPTDGSPLTFTASTPGEWMLARFSLSTGDIRSIHLHAAEASGDWSAFVDREQRYLCTPMGPLDCGTGTYATVDATHPDSGPLNLWNPTGPWVMVVRTATGQGGTVTVSLPPAT